MYQVILFYFIVVLLLVYSIIKEWNEFDCKDPPCEDVTACGCFNSNYIIPSTASPGDKTQTIIDKTRLMTDGQTKIVNWRKAYISACFITMLLILFTQEDEKIPDWRYIGLKLIISFSVTYFIMNFIEYHINDRISNVYKNNLDLLQNSL